MDMLDEVQSGCSSAEPFALRVVGDSMAPEFNEGQIVIVDPSLSARAGTFVVVDYGGEIMFGQFIVDGDRRRLEFLNTDYLPIELAPPFTVKGVVIQRAGRRRNERKHYEYPG